MYARTLFDKLWDAHVVAPETETAPAVLYIDLHLIHEVTSPQAFAELAARGLPVARAERTKGTLDHSTPTLPAMPPTKSRTSPASIRVPVRSLSSLRLASSRALRPAPVSSLASICWPMSSANFVASKRKDCMPRPTSASMVP